MLIFALHYKKENDSISNYSSTQLCSNNKDKIELISRLKQSTTTDSLQVKDLKKLKTYSKTASWVDETVLSLSLSMSTEARNTAVPFVHTKPYTGCNAV